MSRKKKGHEHIACENKRCTLWTLFAEIGPQNEFPAPSLAYGSAFSFPKMISRLDSRYTIPITHSRVISTDWENGTSQLILHSWTNLNIVQPVECTCKATLCEKIYISSCINPLCLISMTKTPSSGYERANICLIRMLPLFSKTSPKSQRRPIESNRQRLLKMLSMFNIFRPRGHDSLTFTHCLL